MKNHELDSIHPQFWDKLAQVLPEEEIPNYRQSLLEEAVTAIRLHPLKGKHDFSPTNIHPLPWHPNGFVLKKRPEFSPDPFFHSAAYYVQDSSAQFLHHILNSLKDQLPANPLVGDICAAPGGKSTIILDFLQGSGLLVSNEIVPKRNAVLRDNLTKWGYLNLLNSRKETDLLKNCGAVFDLMVIDAPCSGEGMFRKSEAARKAWTPELVEKNAHRQLKILEDSLHALKPGGYVVYCNCTMNFQENEGVVIALSEKNNLQALKVDISESWNIHLSKKNGFTFYRFFFHRISGEGMTYCVFKKQGDSSESIDLHTTSSHKKPNKKQAEEFNHFIRKNMQETGHFYLNEKGELFYLPQMVTDMALHLITSIRATPLPLGEFRKDLFFPSHFLLMAGLQNQQIPVIHLDQKQTYLLLKKIPFKLDTSEKGWAVASYQGQAISWIKIHPKGGKFTNYYPNSLRLLNY